MDDFMQKPLRLLHYDDSQTEWVLLRFSAIVRNRVTHVLLCSTLLLVAIATFSFTNPWAKTQSAAVESALPAISSSKISILPLGDSITQGQGSTHLNGYRGPLKASLDDLRLESVFIGSQRAGDMANNEHEGYPGLIINHILMRIQMDSILSHRPDVVLLHAGTNDMAHDASRQYWKGASARLEILLDDILRVVPNATVMVAQIMQASLEGFKERIDEYNVAIPGLVAARAQAGAKIMDVDMSNIGAGGTHLVDGAHPDDTGYAMMADVWLAGLKSATQKGWIGWPQAIDPENDSIEEAFEHWQESHNSDETLPQG
ncbi:carbohydrate esterase family 3 protein [Dothistroma septosporum NZE10]|uniref:Carbohydrate esterase family 3 protein n=1 Tax=Dothistroma septosporum (strain NZE10 / CBS 128990) TaxID=675120 RepID=N1PR46_DOTSN|nr:carbohydrate esterase family 3 protein [Dothistroma septosporum NZE10]